MVALPVGLEGAACKVAFPSEASVTLAFGNVMVLPSDWNVPLMLTVPLKVSLAVKT